ncbi:hypothetical protein [Deinococcus pimensis]|uniref:hypothetical protein n=1 Tax=Deinococcus pimensis TaxID=309888 RepID=UPI00048226A4|nr:hypothetical protein [Deinococcus pimensis]
MASAHRAPTTTNAVTRLPLGYVIPAVAAYAASLPHVLGTHLDPELNPRAPLIALRTHKHDTTLLHLYRTRPPSRQQRAIGVLHAMSQGWTYRTTTAQELLGDDVWASLELVLKLLCIPSKHRPDPVLAAILITEDPKVRRRILQNLGQPTTHLTQARRQAHLIAARHARSHAETLQVYSPAFPTHAELRAVLHRSSTTPHEGEATP